MLYSTIQQEGCLQKAAAALGGAMIGGLTNADEHPVAGTIGGAAGGHIGAGLSGLAGLLLAGKSPKLYSLFNKHPLGYTMASQAVGAVPGGYAGGKAMAGLSSLLGLGNEKDLKGKVEDLVDQAKDRLQDESEKIGDRLQEESDKIGLTDAIDDARSKLGI